MALRDLHISGRIPLPKRLLSVRFARSGGPGGQHVNKAESKVDLRLDVQGLEKIWGQYAADRIRAQLASRLNAEDQLRVVVEEYRDQPRNMEVAHLRLEALLKGALAVVKPRKKTRPSRGSVRRRLDGKKQMADKKKGRSWRPE